MQQGYTQHSTCDHIFFIGFLGAGKTTLARNLGNMFHRNFIDIDRAAERILKATIQEVYETEGEEAFRQAESQALNNLFAKKSYLVSCGSSIVLRQENIDAMKAMGSIVYLEGSIDDTLSNIQYFGSRPDYFNASSPQELYDTCVPLYNACCDYKIAIAGKDFEEVCQEAGALLWDAGLL